MPGRAPKQRGARGVHGRPLLVAACSTESACKGVHSFLLSFPLVANGFLCVVAQIFVQENEARTVREALLFALAKGVGYNIEVVSRRHMQRVLHEYP